MAREIVPPPYTVFTLEELTPEAQERAVERMAAAMAEGWDDNDRERIAETIVYAFAGALKAPGWYTYGSGDFPGIDGVKLTGWDIDRGEQVTFEGHLYPDNAPALPWAASQADSVQLNRRNYGSSAIEVHLTDKEEDDVTREYDVEAALIAIMADAVQDALNEALKGGRDEYEYMTSAEYIREHIEANGIEFTEDGDLA